MIKAENMHLTGLLFRKAKKSFPSLESICFKNGARGRTRTDMALLPVDFESTASTDFTTRALLKEYNTRPVFLSITGQSG